MQQPIFSAVFIIPLFLILIVSVLLMFSFSWLLVQLLQWRSNYLIDKRLPPGSMGWPFLGETLKLYTQNPNTFFSKRLIRYGSIFKTHILGCPCVLVSNPEAVKVVLVSQANLFKPTYPPSKEMMIGPEAIFFHQGDYHTKLRKLFQSSFLPNAIKGSVSDIEHIVLQFLPSWENTTINTLKEMKKFTFDVAMHSVFGGYLPEISSLETIKELYLCLDKGYNSMPFNLPFSPFRKAMKARKVLNETLMRVIEKRRRVTMESTKKQQSGGLLEVLLRSSSKEHVRLTDSQVADNIIGVIFAARDTTASVITWVLKYLHDHQDYLRAVTEEQEAIRRRRIEENRGLTWEDTKMMQLTSRVIQETLRRASVLSFTFRETVKDLEFEGYIIPKGWKVLPLFRSIHHCEDFFPEPEIFDPSRFEVPPRPNSYMPFGNGVHSCPGNELAKLEMLVLLHHLTTTYRWEVVGKDDGIKYRPFPVPKRGLPIRVTSTTAAAAPTV